MKTHRPYVSPGLPKGFRRRLKISVTQKEIDEARKGKADGCMILKAIQRDHPKWKRLWVDKNQIRYTDTEKNCIYTYDMPPRGRVMLLKWDSGEPVAPFTVFARNPVVRERELDRGYMRAKASEQHSKSHWGAVPSPKTKEARSRSGRDRVFGSKQWADELAQVRADLGVTK